MSSLRETTLKQGCSITFHPSRWWGLGAALNPGASSTLWQPKTLNSPAVAINNTRSSQSTRSFVGGERIHGLCLDIWKVPELSHCFLIDCDHCDQSKSSQWRSNLPIWFCQLDAWAIPLSSHWFWSVKLKHENIWLTILNIYILKYTILCLNVTFVYICLHLQQRLCL